MGEHRPAIGERVTWHTAGGELVFAIVIAVYAWDLVDLRLEPDGPIIRGVRRVIDVSGFDHDVIAKCMLSVVGRFQRLR